MQASRDTDRPDGGGSGALASGRHRAGARNPLGQRDASSTGVLHPVPPLHDAPAGSAGLQTGIAHRSVSGWLHLQKHAPRWCHLWRSNPPDSFAVARAKLPPRYTVSDSILASGDRKEGLSRAYVHAVAAAAGYTLTPPDLDRDGVDVQVRAGGPMRPSLDMQLKATVRLVQHGAHWRFRLPKRNYDLLREPTMVPRVLVVFDLPEDEERWVSASEQELVMRRCAYWVTLAGAPESENVSTVTVSIPTRNRLDVPGLKDLMDRARKGKLS